MTLPARTSMLVIAAALAGTSATAIAQTEPAPEEITIVGRVGTAPESVRSLSTVVSYRDLDLSTDAGKKELRRRVDLTARYLCETLGETDAPPAPPCRSAAVKDAMSRVNTLEASAAPRGTTWVRGPAWVPVYPQTWGKKYK